MRKSITCFVACVIITFSGALPEYVNAKTYAVNDYVKVILNEEPEDKKVTIDCRIKTVLPDGSMELEGTEWRKIGENVTALHIRGTIVQSDIGGNNIVNGKNISNSDIYEVPYIAAVEQADSKPVKKKKHTKTVPNQIAKAVFFAGETFEGENLAIGVAAICGVNPNDDDFFTVNIDGVYFGVMQENSNKKHENGGTWLLLYGERDKVLELYNMFKQIAASGEK
ncbi:MAG: flagellar basal body L-ring protein FlgH [Planctomycetaceae bacterium]|jgi:hypothetical protein|nr:flagellar basal body L-ring protein FlgH [Planctomycetaceae bacterium]